MACFFDCFGFRTNNSNNNHTQHRNSSNPPIVHEKQAPEKIRLSSLFTAEEKEEGIAVKEKENETLVRRVGRSEVDEELVKEAKFLKACGTLPETPVEIRKRVTIVENSDVRQTPHETKKEETGDDTFHSFDLQSFHSALESSPVTPDEIKNVDFPAEYSEKLATKPHSVMKSSPYPTPLRITDGMQTPGTVFATNMKSLTKGNGRIRSQYLHNVLNPIGNLCPLDELKEDNSVLEASDHEGENISPQGNAIPSPVVCSSEKIVTDGKLRDASLSAWLKPVSAKDDGNANRKTSVGRAPGDRPIIGLVATHWNPEEEVSNISPKGWDGNGIPNSTTKYKEDQMVCWHATPFEERLEKALSEETIAPQRKLVMGDPITFEEMERQDTATSQIKSMTSPKSVVSF